ncbi:penicillin-binding protein 1C [Yoonia sp. R2331]|uniref:penicillin-binding protein 1C n=1 Tax=Yoonia sp. R2331 TaxID=3237238 RepID=UPI0034E5FA0D
MTRWVISAAVALWALAAARDGVNHWVEATVLPPLVAETGVEVRDAKGALLRAYTVSDGRWRLGVSLDAVDPAYVAMLIRYEDKRFYQHSGVDPLALLRGVAQALRNGRVVSGGSTLTMQVARLLEDGSTGTWAGKLRQIRLALALERQLDKDEILTLYLNRAPFGGNLEGVRAATRAWFGKPPQRLTPAEAALLVALPQAPERRRPDRFAGAANVARDRVLDRLHGAGALDASTARSAQRTPVSGMRHAFPALAPHLADRARAADPLAHVHQLTIDAQLQRALEALAATATQGRSDRVQVAIVVADHTDGRVLASVGSAAYRADGRAGFIDLTQARRSPGSTLKPLIYALAFDRGLAHPETLIADTPVNFDGYRPQNFDGQFRGELRVRTALHLSLNIPVVRLTEALGPYHVMAALDRAGAAAKVPGDVPGLAVALGGVGISLQDMVQLYAGLAQGGSAVPLQWRAGDEAVAGPRITGPVASWQVADILLQTPRPRGVRALGIAYKTGTSYGHRDAWAIGFDGRHVVGVWMGRADGTPVPEAFGGDLAAPVMFQAFSRLKSEVDPIGPPPPATLLLPTSQLPVPLQRFGGPDVAVAGPQIAFPPEGAVLPIGPTTVKVRDGRGPFTVLANGAPVAQSHRRDISLDGLGAGFSALTVIDADGRSDRAQVEVR